MGEDAAFRRYCARLLKLKRANGAAPHKPVLLLAVFHAVACGLIRRPFFEASPELIALFRQFWSLYVRSPQHHPVFTMPFTKMGSEPFWRLVLKPAYQALNFRVIDLRSLNRLHEVALGAEIDAELFQLLQSPVYNEALSQAVAQRYFPDIPYAAHPGGLQEALGTATQTLLEEQSGTYSASIQALLASGAAEAPEEIAVRGAAFKRLIPQLYRFTCAVSGWSLVSAAQASLIDACHIVPFAQSLDDTVGNGIALSPNIHRAFDRGLLGIDTQYRVVLSGRFTENDTSFSLRPLEGRRVLLPENPKHWPSPDHLRWHMEHIFQ